MKPLLLTLCLLPTLIHADAPSVGSVSDPVSFATFSGTTPMNSGLGHHDGEILVLMYFTSW